MKIELNCKLGEEKWTANITKIKEYNGVLVFRVQGRGSSIEAITGKTERHYWINFPELSSGCSLSHPTDIYWNSEEVGYTLMSDADGITVATALLYLEKYINDEDIGF